MIHRLEPGFRRSAILLVAALTACDGAPTDARVRPAALTIVAGTDQVGAAGRALSEPFSVRVTNAAGESLERMRVDWTVVSGAGRVNDPTSDREECGEEDLGGMFTYSLTSPAGTASVYLVPQVLGPVAVRASVATEGAPTPDPVTFTAEATHPVVWIGPVYEDCTDWLGEAELVPGAPWFRGPEGGNEATVPVGTKVEWIAALDAGQAATVTATSAPPGGTLFDSDTLRQDERFEFTPNVAGTWAFEDRVSGEVGTLTAEAGS